MLKQLGSKRNWSAMMYSAREAVIRNYIALSLEKFANGPLYPVAVALLLRD
jgi:hypothetical protein